MKLIVGGITTGILVSLTLLSAPARPDDFNARLVGALVPRMQTWLEDSAHLKAPRPVVKLVSPAQLRILTGVATPGGACLDGVIFLDEEVDYSAPAAASVILHELVHMTQNGCPRPANAGQRKAMEDEAYALQTRWLLEVHGLRARFVR